MSKKARNQFLFRDEPSGVEVWVKRLDELHPEALGNKIFKLKYNLVKAHEEGYSTLLTFGGAYSNHIVATAILGRENGFKTIGVIRGEELGVNLDKTLAKNPTLRQAAEYGMIFHFVSRKDYRLKGAPKFITGLREQFGDVYILPEGGTNALAIKGSQEILTANDKEFDIICCAVGTGGTIAGIINASYPYQEIWGFSALNTDLSGNVKTYTEKRNWKLFEEDNFGGFAKINTALVRFINSFSKTYHLPLESIYTGKMFYALNQKIQDCQISKNSRILVIHTGGLQGIRGMNNILKHKNLPIIETFS